MVIIFTCLFMFRILISVRIFRESNEKIELSVCMDVTIDYI